MSSHTSGGDKLESVELPLQTIRMGPFELAPEFQHLRDAPIGEFETCNTDAARVEPARRAGIRRHLYVMGGMLLVVLAAVALIARLVSTDLAESRSSTAWLVDLGLVCLLAFGCGFVTRGLLGKPARSAMP